MDSKRSIMLLRKSKFMDMLLKEGERYLAIMKRLYGCYQTNAIEYKKLLFVMDRYTRYKAQLKEDLEELRELFEEIDELVAVDDQPPSPGEAEVEDEEDESVGQGEGLPPEERLNLAEEENAFIEEQVRYFHNIICRKNILSNMESIFHRVLNADDLYMKHQRSVHSKLEMCLKNYSERVETILKRYQLLLKSLNEFGDKQLTKMFHNNYIKLQQLLNAINEKQKFFTDLDLSTLRGGESSKSADNDDL